MAEGCWKQPGPDTPDAGNRDDPITLYVWGRVTPEAVTDVSALGAKVEAFLRMAGLDYTAVKYHMDDPSVMPKGKLPTIKHGDRIIADSTFIIKYLLNTYGDTLKIQPAANARDRGIALAAQRMCEDHMYFLGLCERWGDDEVYPNYAACLTAAPPFDTEEMRTETIPQMREYYMQQTWLQGVGRHSVRDREQLFLDDLQALSDILGDNDYITGDAPVPEDASVYGFLEAFVIDWMPIKQRALVAKFPNLLRYVDRIRSLYFPPDRPSSIPCENTHPPELVVFEPAVSGVDGMVLPSQPSAGRIV